MPDSKPHILLLSLGGTIAMRPGTRGATPALSADDLATACPGLSDKVELNIRSVKNVPSVELRLDDLAVLAADIARAFQSGIDGVVITQGTDTLEETAFGLDLLLPLGKPVVITGAMRHAGLPGADGPANLMAAIQVAASPESTNLGVLVVMGDEIHAAAQVRKAATSRVAAFTSAPGGLLGYVVEDRVRIMTRPTHIIPVLSWHSLPPPVAIVTVAYGDDGAWLAQMPANIGGLVVASAGGGHVPSSWVPILETVARRMPVVLASRAGSGDMLHKTYGYPGGEIDLISRGLLPAGFLDPLKARLLLSLLLASGANADKIQRTFLEI